MTVALSGAQCMADPPSAKRISAADPEFPALVADGEPDEVLGPALFDGGVRFANAPRAARGVSSIAWSPNGRTLASLDGATILLWDPLTGRELRRLEGHSGLIEFVGWSPDGKTLASGSLDRTVRLWDSSTGREVHRIEGFPDSVDFVVWSPDGKTLAVADWKVKGSTIGLWDPSTGQKLRELKGHPRTIHFVAWRSDRKMLASAGDDSTIRLWDPSTGQEIPRFEGQSTIAYSVAWSPDGKTLASGSMDYAVRLWDPATGRQLRELQKAREREQGEGNAHTYVEWSPDGTMLASKSSRYTVRVWDPLTGRVLREFEALSSPVEAMTWSPDGRTLAIGLDDYTIRLWDPSTGRELRQLKSTVISTPSAAWSPDGKTLATGHDSAVRLLDPSTGRALCQFEGHSAFVTSVAWSPNGGTLASGSSDSTVRLWDPSTGRELRRLEGHSDAINFIAWSPDGKTLASGSEDRTISLWDPSTGRELRRLEGHSGTIDSLTWSPDGDTLASVASDHTIRLWDPSTGQEHRLRLRVPWAPEVHHRLEFKYAVGSVAWHPNGTYLTWATMDGARSVVQLWNRELQMWNTHWGVEGGKFRGHSDSVTSLAWRPDGRTLASGSADATIRLWKLELPWGEPELRRLEGHTDTISSLAWSPDGKRLASASWDGSVRIWTVETPQEASLALVRWDGNDGWVIWRANQPEGHRVLRGENGQFVKRVNSAGLLESVAPSEGTNPNLSAHATLTHPASPGAIGALTVKLSNATGATPAIWVELQSPPESEWLFHFPPTIVRLEPGTSQSLTVEFSRPTRLNPKPLKAKVVLSIRHAHDRGKGIDVPAELEFASADVSVAVEPPRKEDTPPTIPVSLTNSGNRATGRDLAVSASFFLKDNREVPSNFKTELDAGLEPDAGISFSLDVPKEVLEGAPFRVRISAQEGLAPGVEPGSQITGFVSQWTHETELLAPRLFWGLFAALAGLSVLLLAGRSWMRSRQRQHASTIHSP